MSRNHVDITNIFAYLRYANPDASYDYYDEKKDFYDYFINHHVSVIKEWIYHYANNKYFNACDLKYKKSFLDDYRNEQFLDRFMDSLRMALLYYEKYNHTKIPLNTIDNEYIFHEKMVKIYIIEWLDTYRSTRHILDEMDKTITYQFTDNSTVYPDDDSVIPLTEFLEEVTVNIRKTMEDYVSYIPHIDLKKIVIANAPAIFLHFYDQHVCERKRKYGGTSPSVMNHPLLAEIYTCFVTSFDKVITKEKKQVDMIKPDSFIEQLYLDFHWIELNEAVVDALL